MEFSAPRSLVDEAVEIITDRIVKGVYPPGDRLVEGRLAEEFGISRAPLRECFRVLQREGLVTIIPRRGTHVRTINPQEVDDIYACRGALEALSARLAAPKLDEQALADLRAIVENMDHSVAQGDVVAFHALNVQFHDLVAEKSGNGALVNLLRTLGMQVLWMRFTSLSMPGRMPFSLEKHHELLKAFEEGDGNRAAEITAFIIDEARRVLRARVASREATESEHRS